MGDIESEVIAAYRQILNRPRNLLDALVYDGFVMTITNQAFHVAAGSNLLQFLNIAVQRSTKFININHLPRSQRPTPKSE